MEFVLVDLDKVVEKRRMDFDFYNPNQVKIKDQMVKEWKIDRLNNVCHKIETGKTAPRDSYPETGIRIIKVKNITGNGINWEKHSYITEEFYEKNKKKSQVQLGDILMLCSAHNKMYIGRCDIIDSFPEEVIKNDVKCCCVGELIIIRANPEKIIPEYLITFLRLPIVQEQIIRMVKGQSAHLYSKELQKLDLIIPDKKIQEQIAEINLASQKEYQKRIRGARDALNSARNQISKLILGERKSSRKV